MWVFSLHTEGIEISMASRLSALRMVLSYKDNQLREEPNTIMRLTIWRRRGKELVPNANVLPFLVKRG